MRLKKVIFLIIVLIIQTNYTFASKSISIGYQAKYNNFDNFDYVNTTAKKGGTIIISALTNLFFLKSTQKIGYLTILIALFFGLIHGFGFANFFNQITFNDGVDLVALIGFSFGVETAQILIATSILILNSILFLINPGFRKNYFRLISIIVCLLTILIFI